MHRFPTKSALALMLAACAADPAETERAAEAHLAARDYAAARIEGLNLLKARPGDRTALEILARSELALGNGEAAFARAGELARAGAPAALVAALTAEAQLLRGKPDEALKAAAELEGGDGWRLRGRARAALGDGRGAVSEIEAGLAKLPGNRALLRERARLHLAAGEREQAFALARRTIKGDRDDTEGLVLAGEAQLGLGMPQVALGLFQKALRLQSGNAAALTGMAAAYGELGHFGAMAATLDRVDAIAAKQPVATLLRAQLAARRGDWGAADRLLQTTGDTLSAYPAAQRLTGEVGLARKKPETAIQALGRYTAAIKDDEKAWTMLAEAQVMAGNAATAAALLRPVASDPAASPEALALMAKLAKQAGAADADAFESRARSPNPRYVARLLVWADQAAKAMRWNEAIEVNRKLDALTGGKNPAILNNLGWALYQAGRNDEAKKALEKAYALAPDNPSIADSYAWVSFKTGGDRDKALAILQKAGAAAPANATIAQHIAAIEGS